MHANPVRDRLVEHGSLLFSARKRRVVFTGVADADKLLNDLKHHPHAFVLACIMDRQIKAERAWLIPFRISKKLGDFSFESLARCSRRDIRRLMSKPQPLHRFSERMSDYFYSGIQRIKTEYDGDASRIWSKRPSSAEIVSRFLDFDGVGPKIATMAANILARDFKIPMADHYSIDISADVHVKRVFARLGLSTKRSTVEQLVYKARALHPEYPGLMDLCVWEIGKTWCAPNRRLCRQCYMSDLCPSATLNE